jgi:hypothetical protein
MKGLLGEFRAGNIGDRRVEKIRLGRHLGELCGRWDERFPGLLAEPFAHSPFKGLSRRGRQDGYLKGIIARLLEGNQGGMIVNPGCVWGRHARDLARRLGSFTIIGTDIQGAWDWLYGHIPCNTDSEKSSRERQDRVAPAPSSWPPAKRGDSSSQPLLLLVFWMGYLPIMVVGS